MRVTAPTYFRAKGFRTSILTLSYAFEHRLEAPVDWADRLQADAISI